MTRIAWREIESALDELCRIHGVTKKGLLSKSQKRAHVRCRMDAAQFFYWTKDLSSGDIGIILNRDESTIRSLLKGGKGKRPTIGGKNES